MILSWIFTAISGVITIGTYIYIYKVANSILLCGQEVQAHELTHYGWQALKITSMAFGTYGLGLMLSHLTAFNMMSKVRIQLIRHLEKLPLGYFSENASGEIRKTIEKSVENIENFVAHQMPDATQSMIMPIAFLISMFYFDWRMSLICLIPIMIGFISLYMMLKGESRGFIDNYQTALSDMGSAGVEYVRGISVVKVFGQTVHSFKQFHKSIMNYKRFSVDYVMSMKEPMSIYITAVNGLFFVLVPIGIILYNISANAEKVLHSLIFFIVFTPLVSVLLMRIMNSSSNMMMTTQALDSIEKILEFPEQNFHSASETVENFQIEFCNISFRYKEGTEKALNGLSFTAKAKAVTALVGPSGSGKSTVVNLIARFWDDYEGQIFIGGKELKTLDYPSWMKQFSFVFQETSLLKMSIADNVAFCKRDATEKEILEALHEAQCDDILEKLPQGIHTVIGTDGIYLSGGEQQRIALARAILQDAPVILLDEATSFADPENEYLILKALEALVEGKTVIMIAHRLSTVTKADNIIVLKDGKLEEQGNHQELLDQNGMYAHMYKEYNASTAWRIGGK
ncbi:ABC transporter ATP-binding protein [Anaeromonas gelatinilytica]|uniref:ABC transporter ATP-binding protein n=1 Tax=Anaeromonas gelatinilytica TaxID=2683194 RepID=UPI0020786D59|nr:ABC transporter ATP-binding protein [Anaeromonas gelatinilytica]